MSGPDPHDDACAGLHRAVRYLERGDRAMAALELLASTSAAARALGAGELSSTQECSIRGAAREILLATVDDENVW